MTLKLKVRPKLPSKLLPGVAIAIDKDGLTYTVRLDLSAINPVTVIDPLQEAALLFSLVDGSYSLISMASFIANAQPSRVITDAGDVTVRAADGVIALNKGTGAATNVNLPLASIKIGAVLVTDLKGDAGTNNITIVPTSPDTIQGQSSYVIAANGASLVLRPIPGVGYVI